MVVVAIIGILAAIAIPIYGRVQSQTRLAKVQGDLRSMGSAISIFQAHTGSLPVALTDLTVATTNYLGQTAGPFIASVPSPPAGGVPAWTVYATGYVPRNDGTFTLSSSGDGYTVTVP